MTEITPTAAEHAAGHFETAAVQRAITALREDGFVVINDVVDHVLPQSAAGAHERRPRKDSRPAGGAAQFRLGQHPAEPAPGSPAWCFATWWLTRSSAR